MASIRRHKEGWFAEVYVKGARDSAKFRTRREADAWASRRETELREEQGASPAARYTVADLLTRYKEEVSPKKRGHASECTRIDAWLAMPSFPSGLLSDITPDHFAKWRDERLKSVKPGSVLREFSLLGDAFETARREWRWIKENPAHDVKKPPAPPHRRRIISRHEIRAMLTAMRYSPKKPIRTLTGAMAVCFLLAMRTGMRAGELCGLKWDRVYDGYCHLPVTKTTPRDVPLTRKAMRLIDKMRSFDDMLVLGGLKTATLDARFRDLRDQAGLEGFTFHDTRHNAATWMAKKVDVLTLCEIFGWTNPKMAMVYYNPTAADIAKQLS